MTDFREAIRLFNRVYARTKSKREARRIVRERYPHLMTFSNSVVQ